jgi:hypothetical protein
VYQFDGMSERLNGAPPRMRGIASFHDDGCRFKLIERMQQFLARYFLVEDDLLVIIHGTNLENILCVIDAD